MVEKKSFVFVERRKALSIAATCGLSVIEENVTLQGYKLYIVEEWLCDRGIPTNVISSFTGDETHRIQVAVIAISEAELRNPRRPIKDLLDLEKHKYKLASKTPKGYILLTDTSKLPDDVDMVVIPNGDHDAWLRQVYVNINLKRTNCAGRSSLSLASPEANFKKEFTSLYQIAETVELNEAVLSLVYLVQIALYLFKLLDKEYIDGLLCDQTTAALKQFYDFYNPINKFVKYTLKEIWLDPHLLASIISKLIVCRNRIQEANHIIIKDPFIEHDIFRVHIGDYQRHRGIPYTKFIDLETLKKLNLHTPTHSKVSRVLKSTLDDISGTTNFSLQEEVSDPEYFRYHATIESLRMIWRPKLKSKPSKLAGTLLSRVATSFPWTVEQKKTLSNDSHLSFGQSSTSESGGSTSPFASVPNYSDSNISSFDEEIGNTKESPIPDESTAPIIISTSHTKKPSLDITRSLNLRHSASANDTHRLLMNSPSPITRPLVLDNNDTRNVNSQLNQQYKTSKEGERGDAERRIQESVQGSSGSNGNNHDNTTSTQFIIRLDAEAFILYERLIHQQVTIKEHLEQVKTLADDFQQMADHLCEVHTRGAFEIEKMERQSLEFQQLQEKLQGELYSMEEKSGKLIYELGNTNSKLKEIEENVNRFYKSVKELERSLDKSHLATVMLMINFFEHCWTRIKEWRIFDRK